MTSEINNPPQQPKTDHSGHRKRMRTALLEKGGEKFTDAEVLEMLLYYIIPRIDTRKYAEALIEKFGSLEAVLNADSNELSKIPGAKDGAEVLFTLIREATFRTKGLRTEPSLMETERIRQYLIELFKGIPVETVYALYFSSDGSLLGKQIIFRGNLGSVRFSLRTITEGVISCGGHYVVLAHNHPSDRLVPSTEDILTTKRISAHLLANGIELANHYIVGQDDCVPMFR